jgi:hypothetical protein
LAYVESIHQLINMIMKADGPHKEASIHTHTANALR